MSGTKVGGKKAAATSKEKFGADFHAKIGAIGGKKTGMKGFALHRDLAKIAGAKGGKISRKPKKVTNGE